MRYLRDCTCNYICDVDVTRVNVCVVYVSVRDLCNLCDPIFRLCDSLRDYLRDYLCDHCVTRNPVCDFGDFVHNESSVTNDLN